MCRSSWTNGKKNINIKRKVINNKAMKISQSTDDTQILLDGTEQVLMEKPSIIVQILLLIRAFL